MEHVVLLDDSGFACGTAEKRTVHHEATPLHLAYSCYIFDSAGRLYVTRRSSTKATWPGIWTNSCCGHPAPGEALTHAVRRRVREELSVTLTDLKLILPDFRYRAVMGNGIVENEICPVFSATTSQVPQPDPAETDSIRTFEWTDFVQSVKRGTFVVSPWCRDQVSALATLDANPDNWRPASVDLLPPAAIWCDAC
ncbi:isopentenyl-diphosphate Delta-isomerase [Mycobacterium vicinigordonae]|uniref:Isopentenyl-diphosphate Delta-isomerase n=1 Tax=Mycobacterium vicinigordonae TaxID=1719132 RepID=A0A7D6DYI9_9MYCO|nr:isopentenyl-diphosphate Delta-isomerase [Mycobacterium vicinigordonae]QLL07864.1 isopentenyl-diphosphate Delta-isomerase [Mycobacterium vicinigordonae]